MERERVDADFGADASSWEVRFKVKRQEGKEDCGVPASSKPRHKGEGGRAPSPL